MHIKETMKKHKFAIPALAAITALMLLSTTATITMSTKQNVFAEKYGKNQATSEANACGNEFLPLNIGCQNIHSQVQGDKNAVALSAEQRFPSPSPPNLPDTCEECFTAFLSNTEIDLFLNELSADTSGQLTSLEQLCLNVSGVVVIEFALTSLVENNLIDSGVDEPTIDQIIACLRAFFGLPSM
jgi:hypothetical protein